MTAPFLLDADGTASMATMLMMSHHGMRRDLARFTIALGGLAEGDAEWAAALGEEWKRFRATLHGHHEAEDMAILPGLREKHAAVAPVLDGLTADHRRIDPLLERGDALFAELPRTRAEAAALVADLAALLDGHLEREEASVLPLLREVLVALPIAEEHAALYAQGFAWASHGIAPEVLKAAYALLPELLVSRLPAARAAFEERCARVWGLVPAGASRTSVPDWLAR